MRTPKAEKLPSGKFRARLQVDGNRFSAVGKTRKEAQDKCLKKYLGFLEEKRVPLTVGEAIDRYIQEKDGTLSPSTIRGYKASRKNYLQSIMGINLSDLVQSDIQMAISQDALAGKSPKTIKNANGLLTATLKEFRPSFQIKTKLPQKEVHEAKIFTEKEMQKVWETAKGTNYELPILLASWLGLRVSEIIGLKFSDISLNRDAIHVQRARVPDSEGNLVEKGTKTVSGDRWVKLPKEIADLIHERYNEDPEAYICPTTRAAIYEGFVRICKKAGIKPCKFHELRHFAASEALAVGVPNKYSMKRMGHATDHMLKTVYQHVMRDKEDEFGALIDEKMREIYENGHENGHTE